MVSAPVHAVDHDLGCAVEFVVETPGDQMPDGWPRCVPAIECKVSDSPLDARLGESSVDTPDDIIALAECAQRFWTTIPHAYRMHVQREFLISSAASDL